MLGMLASRSFSSNGFLSKDEEEEEKEKRKRRSNKYDKNDNSTQEKMRRFSS
jgi:hypothetical protein